MEKVPGEIGSGGITIVAQKRTLSSYLNDESGNMGWTRAHKNLGMSKRHSCPYNEPVEISNSSKDAMEFLCRSWSPSASGFLHAMSTSSALSSPRCAKGETEEHKEKQEAEKAEKTVTQSYNSTINKRHNTMMELKQTNGTSKGKSLITFFRSRREKKKEDIRFQTSKLHVALSLTQLAAAISSFVNNGGSSSSTEYLDINNRGILQGNQDMGIAVASAASLMTTVWAEAAEILGANRTQVSSTINSGMAIRTPIDMVALTATAATCLRGAATLRTRALANFSQSQVILKAGAQIRTLMPSGQKEYKWVTIYLKKEELILSFKKKYLGGALTTSQEYKAINIVDENSEVQGCCSFSLKTNKGIIKLLFQDEKQSSVWISTISSFLVHTSIAETPM